MRPPPRARCPVASAALVLAFLAALPATPAARAQTAEGRVLLQDWPAGLRRASARVLRRYDALPDIDTLALGYRVAAAPAPDGGAGVPIVDLAVRWVPGGAGILDGRRVTFASMPKGLRLVAFVLEADVEQDGRRVAGFTVEVDSVRLAPRDVLALTPEARWTTLFDGLDGSDARRLVQEGFALTNLRLTRAAFAVFPAASGPRTSGATGTAPGDRRSDGAARRDDQPDDRPGDRPERATVVVFDTAVRVAWDLAWLFAHERRDEAVWTEDAGRTRKPRGSSGRASRENEEEDEDDDEDDSSLLPAALALGAGVGMMAVLGGTVGTYADADAPIGLAAGRVTPRGGVLLQASANASALGLDGGAEILTVRLLGFGGARRGPLQPLFGLGLRASDGYAACTDGPCGDEDVALDGVLTLGAALNLRRVVLLGGLDVLHGTPEFGAVFNFRAR